VVTIFGNHFDRETRVLLALCSLSDQEHEFKEVAIGRRENRQDDYAAVNPTKEIPTVIMKDTETKSLKKLIGSQLGEHFLYEYD